MVEVVLQIVDFLFKAVVAYARTPEGLIEFNQIEQAVQALWQAEHPGQALPNADLFRSSGPAGFTGGPGDTGKPTKESIRS